MVGIPTGINLVESNYGKKVKRISELDMRLIKSKYFSNHNERHCYSVSGVWLIEKQEAEEVMSFSNVDTRTTLLLFYIENYLIRAFIEI